jgi:hypothetical protein
LAAPLCYCILPNYGLPAAACSLDPTKAKAVMVPVDRRFREAFSGRRGAVVRLCRRLFLVVLPQSLDSVR